MKSLLCVWKAGRIWFAVPMPIKSLISPTAGTLYRVAVPRRNLIRNGVYCLEGRCKEEDIIVIHDGIRPMIDGYGAF